MVAGNKACTCKYCERFCLYQLGAGFKGKKGIGFYDGIYNKASYLFGKLIFLAHLNRNTEIVCGVAQGGEYDYTSYQTRTVDQH